MRAVRSQIDAKSVRNYAFVLIEDGEVFAEHYVSAGAPVDRDTPFAVGSLSKWVSAWGMMRLVEEGRLELDASVSTSLTRWALPPSEFDDDGVTVRRRLSHMSPGTEWRYSGGGYVLLQLLVEEVTGESFNDYMQRAVFAPLGMTRSTYDLDEAAARGLAESFGTDGSSVPHRRFTALARTSLFTSAGGLDPDSGDGAIALQSGNEPFGIRMTGEWVFWRIGRLDFLNSLSSAPPPGASRSWSGRAGSRSSPVPS